ncbi:uncharacterized protein LOC133195910 [Saccostrea echinata]|uniref:uncharacterized protein LOC133195910 n=1 Tax=Saccostrea echinata TaxID=191078 RepID=UPI002A806C09|nr:uncharacterized protein LOC133195910 [Saccostrea echinata]
MEALNRYKLFSDVIDYILSVIIVVSLVPVHAEVCIYYKKSVDWSRMLLENKNSSFPRSIYKSRIDTFYCYTEQYCCGSSCCENKTYKNYYEYYDNYNYRNTDDNYEMSSGGTFGIAIALVVGLTFCLACCISCCKQQENGETALSIREVQPIVAYSSNNGTVVVRQAPPEDDSRSTTSSISDREGSPQSPPSQRQTSDHDYSDASPHYIQGSSIQSSGFNYAQSSDFTAPPPSYDDVISQNYPILSENKNSRTESEH